MKKKFLILPVVAALFAACTNDELQVNENQVQQTVDDGAIAFDAYLNRNVTRAGAPGNMTKESVASGDVSLKAEGFGVFAYYANGDLYSENAIPDFMYNQQVKWGGSAWTYSPIKYWPNEFGSSAVSMGVDRVTFFAYAPYVGVNPATGQLTDVYDGTTNAKSTETGITALTRNGKAGDPYVRYVSAFEPAKCVDLCYGVAAEEYTSSAASAGALDGANKIGAGKPYINVAKPGATSKLKFNFKHALAQLSVKVDADVDIMAHNDGDVLDGNTRIWVRSITFDGIAQRGYLNLNNGIWYDIIDNTKISHANVTIHDGLRDGAEPLASDTYETPIGLNPALVQSADYDVTETPDGVTGIPTYPTVAITNPSVTGVTGAEANLFEGDNILVIPANEQLKVTIVYDVETADPTLSSYLSDGKTKGSTVENKITKSITIGDKALKLEAGNQYTLKLHLGMTSVKFDADVLPWASPANNADDAWLPDNSDATFSITAPAAQAATAQTGFGVSVNDPSGTSVDMGSGFTFASTYSDNNGHSGVDIDLNETGTSTGFTVDLPALTDFFGRVYTITATKTATGEKQTVNITQNAPVITMTTPTPSGAVVTLATPTVTPSITWNDDSWTGTTVEVYDANNGDAVVDPANYTWDAAAHTVTFTADGTYKFKLTKDESSTAVSDAVSVDVP